MVFQLFSHKMSVCLLVRYAKIGLAYVFELGVEPISCVPPCFSAFQTVLSMSLILIVARLRRV